MPPTSSPMSGGSSQDSPPISPAEFQALIEMIGEDTPEIVVDLLDTYLEESVELVRTISAGAQVDNREVILRPAHSLKSSSASIGAMNLSRLSADMEAYARTGMPDFDVMGQAAAIEEEFARVRDALEYEKSQLLNT